MKSKREMLGLKNLVDFRHTGSAKILLPTEEDYSEMVSDRGKPHLFLGAYSEEKIRRAFVKLGITERLEKRGFKNPIIHIGSDEARRHRIAIYYAKADYDYLLGEATLLIEEFETKEPYRSLIERKKFNMLFIQWLCLQDPTAQFSSQKPAFPGQYKPGLGMGRLVSAVFEGVVFDLKLDGIINIPYYIHNAMLYQSRRYRFLDPVAEGKLLALERDFSQLDMAVIAWGIELGCVREKNSGEILTNLRQEMVFPTNEEMLRFFLSDAYHDAVNKAYGSHRFEMDFELFKKKNPLNADGSPNIEPPARESPPV